MGGRKGKKVKDEADIRPRSSHQKLQERFKQKASVDHKQKQSPIQIQSKTDAVNQSWKGNPGRDQSFDNKSRPLVLVDNNHSFDVGNQITTELRYQQMQNGVSRNYLAPGSLTDKNTFMKAFAFNSDVVKHRRSDDKKTNLRFDNGKSRKKSKGKHTFEDMKKKLLKDINHAK